MSGVMADALSKDQIKSILDWVSKRIKLHLQCPTHLNPGDALLASIVPATPELDVSELMNGVINFALVEKEVLFRTLATMVVPSSDQVKGTSQVDGSALLAFFEATQVGNTADGMNTSSTTPQIDDVRKQPFPLPTLGLGQATPFPNDVAGILSQIAGTLSLPKLSISVQVEWLVRDAYGNLLADGTDMISSGLTSPSVSIVIPPLFRELRRDTLAYPGGQVVCLSANVSLAIGTEAPLVVSVGPIPVLQLPILLPTVVAMFSEPNFELTEDAAVVLFVPAQSPFASAAPLFRELKKIEGALDNLRSIASIAGFLLGISEVIALTEQPRLRFVAANGIPRLKDIKLKHKPWYNFFGDAPNFDDRIRSLFVFGLPGTKVTFYNDFDFKRSPDTNQGYYTVELFDTITLGANPDPSAPLPDFFVAIRAYPSGSDVHLDATLSNRMKPPPTAPAGRIREWHKDTAGDAIWDFNLSSVNFHQDLINAASAEIAKPTIPKLTCFQVARLRPEPGRA